MDTRPNIRLQKPEESNQQYKLHAGYVLPDNGGAGTVLERDQVVEFSDGSVFLKEDYDAGQLCFTQHSNPRLCLWMTEKKSKVCSMSQREMVRVKYGKDSADEWVYLLNLELVQPVGENQYLEVFCA